MKARIYVWSNLSLIVIEPLMQQNYDQAYIYIWLFGLKFVRKIYNVKFCIPHFILLFNAIPDDYNKHCSQKVTNHFVCWW